MKTPVEKQGTGKFSTCEINKAVNEFIKKVSKNFNEHKGLRDSFLKIARKGPYIMKDKDVMVMQYIIENYDEEIYENLKRIWNKQSITEDMRKKLNSWSKEGRSNEVFFLDVVSAWLSEDIVLSALFQSVFINNKYIISLNGTDRARKIEYMHKCNRDTDLKLVNKKTEEILYLEVMEDNYGHVKSNNAFDLRFGKYDDILNLTKLKDTDANLVILDIKNQGFIFTGIKDVEVLQNKYFHPKIKKNCTELSINYKRCFKTLEEIINAA